LSICFDHNPSASYAQHGFTEFIELRFATAVYPQAVYVGENRGMCSVVRIKGRLSTESQYVTLWSGQADPECEAYHSLRQMYRTFAPQLCEHPRWIDTVRLELDARAIDDWNEIDYVRLVGSTELPTSILPHGTLGVIYEPTSGFTGIDVLALCASECPFQVRQAHTSRR
jgi:hypothetical protein